MNAERYSLKNALKCGENGEIEEWIHDFLCNEGKNKAFSDGLKLFKRFYYGPVKMPLSLFKRCCGPEKDMKYMISEKLFEAYIRQMMKEIEKGWDIPPLIVNYADGAFVLNDGNHRFEAMKRYGIDEYYIVIWITEEADAAAFEDKYRCYL
ncbi:MAG: ParB-like nuclease domain-containing protein [Clostridia bacterium]|nr:ParB-like nuclease domain-containing protein [Clostridia bacterium]